MDMDCQNERSFGWIALTVFPIKVWKPPPVKVLFRQCWKEFLSVWPTFLALTSCCFHFAWTVLRDSPSPSENVAMDIHLVLAWFIAALIGAFVAVYTSDNWLKRTVVISAALSLLSGLILAFIADNGFIIAARYISGFSYGFAFWPALIQATEVADKSVRYISCLIVHLTMPTAVLIGPIVYLCTNKIELCYGGLCIVFAAVSLFGSLCIKSNVLTADNSDEVEEPQILEIENSNEVEEPQILETENSNEVEEPQILETENSNEVEEPQILETENSNEVEEPQILETENSNEVEEPQILETENSNEVEEPQILVTECSNPGYSVITLGAMRFFYAISISAPLISQFSIWLNHLAYYKWFALLVLFIIRIIVENVVGPSVAIKIIGSPPMDKSLMLEIIIPRIITYILVILASLTSFKFMFLATVLYEVILGIQWGTTSVVFLGESFSTTKKNLSIFIVFSIEMLAHIIANLMINAGEFFSRYLYNQLFMSTGVIYILSFIDSFRSGYFDDFQS